MKTFYISLGPYITFKKNPFCLDCVYLSVCLRLLYAQSLILVNLILVNLFSFFNFTPNGLVRF